MTKTEKEIFTDFEDKYQASKEELDKRFSDFNEYEELYWGYLDNTKNAWKSNIFDPESFEKVERVVSHLFASVPRGRVMPRDDKEDVSKAPIHDELFRYQWTKPAQRMHSKLQRIGRSFSIFGTAFCLLEWRFEKTKKTINGEEKNITVWDDPYMKDLYIYDCFPDPAATNVEDMEYFITNEYTTVKGLKSANIGGRYKNLGKLEELVKDKKNDASSDSWRNRVDDIQGLDSGVVKERILIRRMFTRDKWVTVVPDHKLVIEDRANPYWHGDLPVHIVTNYEYPNQLYGRGELDVIRKLQKGLNNVINQRLDNVRMILNPVVKSIAGSRFAHTWKFRPGQKWVMDRLDEVEQFQIADVTGNTFQSTVNFFKESMTKSLGQNDIMGSRDLRNSMNITATRDKLAALEQNVRMKAKEAQVDAFVTRLVNQWIQLNQQFISSTRAVRILGGDNLKDIEQYQEIQDPLTGEMMPKMEFVDGVEMPKLQKVDNGTFATIWITPEDLVGSFDFIIQTGSTSVADPVDEFQNMVTAIGLLKQSEQSLAQNGVKINYQPILEKQLYELGIKDVSNIFERLPMQMGMPQGAPQGDMGMPDMGGMPMPQPEQPII